MPRLGDFVVAKVAKLGAHEYLENPLGRRMRMYPGDLVVGAWGNRDATDFYEGYLPAPGDGVHLLSSDGLVGDGADVVVLEIADGVLQEQTRALAAQLSTFADQVVLAVGDALGAMAAIQILDKLGVSVSAIRGARSPEEILVVYASELW